MAQSAAAMVAIVGGFLVSRVITLSAEQRGLERRVREIRESAEDKRRVLAEVRQQRQEVSWDIFVDLAVETCAKRGGRSSPEQLAEAYWVRGVEDFDEMVDMAARLHTKVQEARRRIESIQSTLPSPSPIPEPLRNIMVNLVGESERSRQRSTIAEQLDIPPGEERIFQAALDEMVPPERSILLAYEPMSGYLGGEDVNTSGYADLVAEERGLRLEVSVLEREEAFFSAELARVAQPRHLGTGIGVLGYLTIVGVIIPIVALATRPVPYSLSSRRVLVTLFISGLLTLFAYLTVTVFRLSTGRKQVQREPSN